MANEKDVREPETKESVTELFGLNDPDEPEDAFDSTVKVDNEDTLSDNEQDVVKELSDNLFDKYYRMQKEGLKRQGVKKATRKERSSIFDERAVMPIDDEVQYESKLDEYKNKAKQVLNSYISNIPLKGIISSTSEIKLKGTTIVCANVMYGPMKVMIPLPYLTMLKDGSSSPRQNGINYARLIVNERIGSEIDFVVKQIDEAKMVAVADRLEAMKLKRQAYFFRRKRGKFALNEGDEVEARVCYVTKQFMCVEVYGVELIVPLRNISYRRLVSARDMYKAGDRLPVTITKLERDIRTTAEGERINDIKLDISVKESEFDPREIYIKQINVGDTLQGKMVLMANKNYYVKPIGIDMDIPCTVSDEFRIKPITGDQVLITISAKDEENLRFRGYIIRVL